MKGKKILIIGGIIILLVTISYFIYNYFKKQKEREELNGLTVNELANRITNAWKPKLKSAIRAYLMDGKDGNVTGIEVGESAGIRALAEQNGMTYEEYLDQNHLPYVMNEWIHPDSRKDWTYNWLSGYLSDMNLDRNNPYVIKALRKMGGKNNPY